MEEYMGLVYNGVNEFSED